MGSKNVLMAGDESAPFSPEPTRAGDPDDETFEDGEGEDDEEDGEDGEGEDDEEDDEEDGDDGEGEDDEEAENVASVNYAGREMLEDRLARLSLSQLRSVVTRVGLRVDVDLQASVQSVRERILNETPVERYPDLAAAIDGAVRVS
jgi:hypothetical protein